MITDLSLLCRRIRVAVAEFSYARTARRVNRKHGWHMAPYPSRSDAVRRESS